MDNSEVLIKDEYKTSRTLYVIEAALEYFISILVGGAYLAKVSTSIGISDAVTGILSAFVSLGLSFQMVAVFLAKYQPVKKWVTILHTLNQLAFALVYVVPFFEISKTAKTVLFIIFLLLGHSVNNVVNSPKINWFMTLIDDKKRGTFTANKEIVSLIGGMTFTFLIGLVIDYYDSIGNENGAFLFCAIGIFALTVLHSCTLIFSKEKEPTTTEKPSTRKLLKDLLQDKTLYKVVFIAGMWNVAHSVATPFYGTYMNNELGFSMTLVALLSAVYSIVRALFSRPMGRFADKHSFKKMLTICFCIACASFVVNTFCTPQNGKIVYLIYYVLYAIAMSGINSGAINLVYGCVKKENRIGAFALQQIFSGVAGFLITIIVSPLVEYVQSCNNTIFGITIYAQQILSFLAFILTTAIVLYIKFALKNIDK